MMDEKGLNNPESISPEQGAPQPNNTVPVAPIPEAPARQSENLRPSLPESEYLIPESMRKLDALLKEIKLKKTQPQLLHRHIDPALNDQANAQLLSLIQGKLDAVGDKISNLKSSQPPPATPPATSADINAQVVNLMQGKLDTMGDKISEKLSALLGELKVSVGTARDAKIKEIQEIAGPEIIDISKLFDEKVASNLGEIGIEEKQAKEVDKSLEKLRKLRGGK